MFLVFNTELIKANLELYHFLYIIPPFSWHNGKWNGICQGSAISGPYTRYGYFKKALIRRNVTRANILNAFVARI